MIWVPVFEGTFYNTAKTMAIKHVWRVRPLLDVEDLIQEAAMVFYRCSEKYYPETCSRPKHFMSLFTVSFLRRIETLANDRFKYREQCAASQFGDDVREGILNREAGAVYNELELELLLDSAPLHIRMTLRELYLTGDLRKYNQTDAKPYRGKHDKDIMRWAQAHLLTSP